MSATAGEAAATLSLGVNALFYIPKEVGGAEVYLLETLKALQALNTAPHLTLFANRENTFTLRQACPEATIITLPVNARNRPARILAEQFRLPAAISRARVDVLWSPGNTTPTVCGVPMVTTIYDVQYKRFPEDVSWSAARIMDLLYPLSVRRSKAIITISEFSKNEIIRFLRGTAQKIAVTHLAADVSFEIPSELPPELAAQLDRTPYLLCVAHTYPHKNLHTLVRAFQMIAADIPHRLVLVGKAQRGEAALQEALDVGPRDRITRIDRVEFQHLAALYQRADLFVFPSLYEGFGLPVLEAMQAGTPVLAAREASVPEVGGDCILYTDANSPESLAGSLRDALNLPREKRSELIEAARMRAQTFSWQASATALLRTLAQAAGKPVEG